MASGSLNRVIQHLRRATSALDRAIVSDGDLLDAFIAERDEIAFEAIVERHGPMVLAVCKRILQREHDAEDAFQATFLVLIRKADSVRPRGQVGNWLYGVACRVALKARSTAGKRRECPAPEEAEARPGAESIWRDLRSVLDEELSRLPDKYRLPVLLCDLQGKSHQQAADQLAWPIGTVSGRLSRARSLLARRLGRHGFTLSAVGLAMLLGEHAAPATLSTGLFASTVQASMQLSAQPGAAAAGGLISSRVATLMEGAIHSMFLGKIKSVMMVVATLAIVGGGVAGLSAEVAAWTPPAPPAGAAAADAAPMVVQERLALLPTIFSLRYDGIIFGPILLFCAGTLVVLSVLLARDLRLSRAVPAQFVKEAMLAARKEGSGGLLMLCKLDDCGLSTALRAALEASPNGGAEARAAAHSHLDWLNTPRERRLTYVAGIGVLSPIFGLLGTLLGVVLVSAELSHAGIDQIRPDMVAAGVMAVSVVLMHELMVSLAAVLVFLNFKVRLRSVTAETRKSVDEVLAALPPATA